MTLIESINSLDWGGKSYPRYDGEMFIGTALALGLGITAAAGSVAGGAIAAHGAHSAADAQAQAAQQAAQLQANTAQKALDWQKFTYGNNLQMASPYVQAGWGSIANLANLMGVLPKDANYYPGSLTPQMPGTNVPNPNQPMVAGGQNPRIMDAGGTLGGKRIQALIDPSTADPHGNPIGALPGANGPGSPNGAVNLSTLVNPDLGASGSLMQGFSEEAPTGATEQNDPGYKFRLAEGQKALERSASAKGNLLTGGTAKALSRYGQDYASSEFNNVYNRWTQRYNMFTQDQTNKYNRLANLAGMGQTSTAQLGQLGQNAAGNIGSILMGYGSQAGQDLNNAAAARASGYVGAANAYGGAIGGIGNSLSQYLLLQKLLSPGSANTSGPSFG